MRKKAEIEQAENECYEKVWYDRSRLLTLQAISNGEKVSQGAIDAQKRIEEKYGVENLEPMDDFEWGMLSGKLSALRWMLGDDWDNLDS